MTGRIPSRGSDQFNLRLPEGMRDRLRDAAEANGRSMNAEIVERLLLSFSIDELNKQSRNVEEEAALKASYALARAEMQSTRDLMRTVSDRLSRIEAAMAARGMRSDG